MVGTENPPPYKICSEIQPCKKKKTLLLKVAFLYIYLLFQFNHHVLRTQKLMLQLQARMGDLQAMLLTSGVGECAEMQINFPLPAKLQL